MKKVAAFLMAVALCICTAGCGAPAASSSAATSTPASSSEAASAPASSSEAASTPAEEVEWPKSSVQLIVSARSGGGTDISARTLTQSLADFGNFPVINNTDGNGTVAWEQVAGSDPSRMDTLLYYNEGFLTSYINGMTDIHPLKDLTPVFALHASGTMYVVVPKESEFNTMEDLVEYCKANPGKLNFGINTGDTGHVMAGFMQHSLGVEWNWTSAGSDGDRIGLILGNNLDATIINQNTVWNYYQSGDIKVLAAIQFRSPDAPEELQAIPTLEECGYENVPIESSVIVWAPNGADPAVYEKINQVFTEASLDPDYVAANAERGETLVSYGTAAETQEQLNALMDVLTEHCRNLGLAAEGR